MEQKNKRLISYSLIGSLLLIFGFYSNTIMYADAVSVSNVTFTAGTTTQDVAYDKGNYGLDDSTAYIVGENAGQAYLFKKSGTSQTITLNATLTGSSGARAIEWNNDTNSGIVVTNDKFRRFSTNLGTAIQFASGTANVVQKLFYDHTNEIMYFCTNDVFGTVNMVTAVPTTLYTDAGTNGILDCAFDIPNNLAVLSGDGIGSPANKDLITVSLSSFTIVSQQTTSDFAYGVCVDDVNGFYWVMISSGAVVNKYNSALTLQTTVSVGTIPRNCSITTDDTARRLYVANEGSDTISIIDIDANAVTASPAVCNTIADRRIDTARLSNVTNTFVTCNSATNSVVIDDTVSDFIPEPDVNQLFCEQPENFNLLRCVLERGDTTPLVGASELIDESTSTIICQLGLIPCTNFEPDNPDTKTNGVGYIMLFVALGIMIGIFWVASRGDLGSIPTFLWFIATLSIVGVITAFDLIDATVLIIAIISIIALATAKAKGIFGSSGLFSGET